MSSNPIYKVVLVGDTEVGKTSILQRLTNNTFTEGDGTTTTNLDSKVYTVDVGNGKKVDLHIWDTAGQERFSTLTATYYRDASGSIVIFDLTCLESFTDVNHWVEDTDRYAKDEICKILVGNKSDLKRERTVTSDKGKSVASTNGIPYIECSAKDGTNIQEIFTTLAKELDRKGTKMPDHSSSAIKITSTSQKKEKRPFKCLI